MNKPYKHLKKFRQGGRFMGELTALPNLGKVLKAQLTEAGITTSEELLKSGSREAWLRIFAFDSSACYNRLLALEGAIRGVRYHLLPQEVKAELKEFYALHKPPKQKRG